MDMRVSVNKVISGTMLIIGTTIGAGILGIPLLTARAGFWPAVMITVLVWVFMVCTGLLYLESTLWMHQDANILSMTKRFLGRWGRLISGGVYLFLYYCLLVAYFAVGAPIFGDFLSAIFRFGLGQAGNCVAFALVFGGVVAFGLKIIDRVNYILVIGKFLAFAALIGAAMPQVEPARLAPQNWSQILFAAPVLFSAFGYHNVIPSLTSYFNRNVRVLRLSILLGTGIPLVIYILWQWLIIGAVPPGAIQTAMEQGLPATAALESLTGMAWIIQAGRYFAFFAVITSMLGVAFSMVDFLGDGFNMSRTGSKRLLLTFLTFLPPFLFTIWDPTIFVTAIGFAGGFGEAFLNGLLPVALVWVGRYRHRLEGEPQLPGNRWLLGALFGCGVLVMIIQLIFTIQQ
ncbi:MAG: tyrP-B [Parachlamydiales bacterium]|nr:tyrP-B [Parachlamydiales bacterium]